MKEKWREFFGFERGNAAASERDELELEEPFEEAEEPPLPIHLGLLFAASEVQRDESAAVLDDAFGEEQDRTELVKYALGDIIFWLGVFTLHIHYFLGEGLLALGSAILYGRAKTQEGQGHNVYLLFALQNSYYLADDFIRAMHLWPGLS